MERKRFRGDRFRRKAGVAASGTIRGLARRHTDSEIGGNEISFVEREWNESGAEEGPA